MDTQQPLNCYIVGDYDYYAAASSKQAEDLHAETCGLDEEDREEAQLVIGSLLDMQCVDEDSREPVGTLRQWLYEATAPGWLAGTE